MPTHPPSPAALLRVTHQPWDSPATTPAMSNSVDRHDRYRLTNRYLEIGGKPAIPVSGELHFSRVPRTRWEERLRLMKAGGITVVASYIFWIHHEPREGTASFEGNLDVAAFVRLCSDIGLDVVLRIGPWCHGEVRNGGFPDWLQSAPAKHRTNDPAYLELVRGWFGHLGDELAGLGGAGSNIIGIQLENELYDQPGHITELKRLARNAGLSAPIWTATAWGGADLPEGEVLPLFGGYGDGFWVDADAPWDPTFREHYFFSHVWDDPGIGADIREHLGNSPEAAAPRTPSALFPPATCELAGGMATAYQRRPWPRGLDVAAVAHNKIGNGSAWQGYYMFAGGSNPDDGLQESQATGYPNDLPRFDYDFHAPIGTSGHPASSFAALRKQHAFLAAFGDRTAEMPSTLPQVMPAGIEDTSTLRWALRSNGNAGFAFITWHQPHVPLGTYEGAQFEVMLDAGPVTFPAVPVDIPAGTIAHWPVNLEAGGVTLEWATASPLSLLAPAREIPGSRPTLVLAAEAGIPVELSFAPGTKVFRPGHADLPAGTDESFRIPTDEPIVLTAQAGDAALDVLVLPADMGNNAWVLDTRRGRELVISQEPVWVDGQGRIAGRFRKQQEVRCYRPASQSFTALPVLVTGAAGDGHSQERDLRAELVHPAAPVPASFGSRANRATAPQPHAIDELAQTYSLEIPAAAFATDHVELDIRWAGDVAQLLVDGRPVADRFWDGSPWLLEVSDAGIRPGSEVILQILPLSPDAKIGLPLEARLRREATAGDLIALDSVRLIPWTGWQEHPEA